jgi:hypothetical protein
MQLASACTGIFFQLSKTCGAVIGQRLFRIKIFAHKIKIIDFLDLQMELASTTSPVKKGIRNVRRHF